MKANILSLFCLTILFTSCSKEEDKNQTNSSNSGVNVKYELIFSTSLSSVNGQNLTVNFTNSNGQNQIETINYIGLTTFSKTITLTNSNRPLKLQYSISNSTNRCLTLVTQGSVKENLYLDGVLTKSTTSNSSSNVSGCSGNIINGSIFYTMQ